MFNLSTFFSFFVAVYVIFHRYASPIPQVTLSEFILLLFWIAFFMFRLKKIRIEWCLIPFCVYLFGYVIIPFTGIISYIPDMLDLVGTAARLLFLYFSIAILGKTLFNLEKGIKFIRYIAIIVSLYACLQIVASKFGIYLTTYIPFLPIMGEYNTDEALIRKAGYELVFRPCSFFTEPSHLAAYLAQALAIDLFAQDTKIHSKYCVFLSFVCLVSRSSTGFILVAFLWILFFFKNHNLTVKQLLKWAIFTVLGIIIALLFIYCFNIWDYFVNRVLVGGIGHSTRFYALKEMFNASDNIIGILFGQGLSQMEFYLPGFARVYLSLGLIGFLLVCLFLIEIYIRGNLLQKKFTILFILLNIGTSIILGSGSMLCLCIMTAYLYDNKNINKLLQNGIKK